MPATIATNNTGNVSKQAPKKHSSKRTRVVRRRGRGGLDSDDEIEREAHTDSDTDENSSVTSVSDSESVSDDDEPHPGIVTPSTTQSPPPLDIPRASGSVKPSIVNGGVGPFVGTTDWAQIVADENAHGASDLPVIDFNDMHTHTIPEPTSPNHSRSRKTQKQNKKSAAAARETAPSPTASPAVPRQPASEQEQGARVDEGDTHPDEPFASSSRPAPLYDPRKRGQSARQAYQERMQADPAFVPRVGEFWGHDDRLLDKDLRSLSGWWRGRWQGRGRGRGFPMRGRGGQFFPGHPLAHEQAEGYEAEKGADEKLEVPPIEKTWGHDGFEEMRRREDQRREDQRHSQPSRQSTNSQRGFTPRGRGGFSARGRGGFARGGGVASSTGGHPRANLRPSSAPVWYIMKPEKVWTKHADNFLYFEPILRPRPGEAPGIRIKLPGYTAGQLVRQRRPHPKTDSQSHAPLSSELVDDEERQFVVRIPAPARAEKVTHSPDVNSPKGDMEPDIPLEEVFTVRPHAAPEYVPLETPVTPQASEATVPPPANVTSPVMSAQPMPETQRQLEQLGFGTSHPDTTGGPSPQIEETLLRRPPNPEMHAPIPQSASSPESSTRVVPPVLPPLQIPPVPQASPSYGSPYTYGTLPPGIAMSHQGFPYELATGRPVYLHTPPPMYAPQPMMQSYMGHPSTSVPFVPGHLHHPSQEYMPHPATPPTGFIDPTTGIPIFAPARQSSRIQIRAPSDSQDAQPSKHARGPSGLRESTTEAEANSVGTLENGAEPQEQPQQGPPMDPAAMAYAPYQQPYYYPDPNGYPGYMDMSHQHVQYDAYPPYEQHAQPIIYY
ncbi:hypothetical protein PHLGIDRAFT_138691 [Phlebiopsis gigantea 11061_1 CR5-6]|uniref:Btz domain-containing protein n=1 Tax=Phlebiopsis gigantea (strain 11061_1 CR5-6) TaxID=745531 RepID=A0A0C3SFY5_PHLG1|nr:hypothetical protein PHLGIDRAFT_138691 [Phlebiopsis gigantea 11061_1 CR5-6]